MREQNFNENQKNWADYIFDAYKDINFIKVKNIKVSVSNLSVNNTDTRTATGGYTFIYFMENSDFSIVDGDNIINVPKGYIYPAVNSKNNLINLKGLTCRYVALTFASDFCKKTLASCPIINITALKDNPFPTDKRLDYLVRCMCEEISSDADEIVTAQLTELIFILLMRYYINYLKFGNKNVAGLIKAKQYIDSTLTKPFDLEETARIAGISKFYFSRLFKEKFGKSPADYYLSHKILYAQHLIRFTDKRLTEIAADLAFVSLSHFSKEFKKHCGQSPSAFKKNLNSKQQ